MPATSRTRAAIASLVLLAACGAGEGFGSGPAAVRAVHLELRLADGRAAAEVLAGAYEVVERREATSELTLAPWRVVQPAVEETPDGLRPIREGGRETPLRRAVLEYLVPVDPVEVDVVALRLQGGRGVRARLLWRPADATLDPDRAEDPRSLEGEPVDGALLFRLARHAHWRGPVAKLALDVTWKDGEPPTFGGVELGAAGFVSGTEPTDLPADGADGGLVAWGLDARRAWPSDLLVPLVARARAPRAARVEVLVSPAFAGALRGATVDCRVEGRRAVVDAGEEPGSWRELAGIQLQASDDGEPRWRPIVAELGALSGGPVELRFTAGGSGPVSGGREPRRARVLWGEPMLTGAPADDRPPNVVLVTLDTLRGDAVGEDTPVLLRLAEEGLSFTDAWSACNATTPSHASILTGTHVQDHGAWGNRDLLGAANRTLAEELRAAGWQTGAAVSVAHLEAGTGLGQGFDRFRQAHPEGHLDGRFATDAALEWIEEWSGDHARPFFLWVHLFDAHTPYAPPPAFRDAWIAEGGHVVPPRAIEPPTVPPRLVNERAEGWLRGATNLEHVRFLYRSGVAYADAELGRLVDGLRGADALDRTLLAVTSDHGESLGEQAVWFGHKGLFRETMHVPLVLRFPDAAVAGPFGPELAELVGTTSDARVSTLDLFPTLVRLSGLEASAGLRGTDLVASARARSEGGTGRRLWFEHSRLFQVGTSDGAEYFVSTVRDGMSYGPVLSGESGSERGGWRDAPKGTRHLFDEASDPRLLRDLALERPERASELEDLIEAWRDTLRATEPARRAVSAQEEAALRAMGYTGDDE